MHWKIYVQGINYTKYAIPISNSNIVSIVKKYPKAGFGGGGWHQFLWGGGVCVCVGGGRESYTTTKEFSGKQLSVCQFNSFLTLSDPTG